MIADLYPPERRATAMAIFGTGINWGILIGFLLGGWINEWFGWRVAFFVVGVPGILLALVFQLTVKEPPRGHSENVGTPVTPPSFGSVVKFMWGSKPLRHIVIAGSLIAFTGYATVIWIPIYLVRIHEMGTGEAGSYLAYSLASAVPLVFIWAAGRDALSLRFGQQWLLGCRHRESYGATTLIPCIHGTNANAGDCVLRPSGYFGHRLCGARVRTNSKHHPHRNAVSRRCH